MARDAVSIMVKGINSAYSGVMGVGLVVDV